MRIFAILIAFLSCLSATIVIHRNSTLPKCRDVQPIIVGSALLLAGCR